MPYIIQINENGSKTTISEDKQTEAMAKTVGLLIEEHQLLDHISMPLLMNKRAILNSSPVHPGGLKMRQYATLSNDCYLCVDIPGRTKTSQMKKMAAKCGVAISFENGFQYKHA